MNGVAGDEAPSEAMAIASSNMAFRSHKTR